MKPPLAADGRTCYRPLTLTLQLGALRARADEQAVAPERGDGGGAHRAEPRGSRGEAGRQGRVRDEPLVAVCDARAEVPVGYILLLNKTPALLF